MVVPVFVLKRWLRATQLGDPILVRRQFLSKFFFRRFYSFVSHFGCLVFWYFVLFLSGRTAQENQECQQGHEDDRAEDQHRPRRPYRWSLRKCNHGERYANFRNRKPRIVRQQQGGMVSEPSST